MIKKIKLEDLKELFELENRVFPDDIFKLSKSSLRYHILKNQMFKIVDDEKIVAYILWLKRKNYYRLYSIAVDNKYQGLGIASKLLNYSFKFLDKSSYSLEVKTSNKKAIKLYEKCGFKIKKVLKNYYQSEDGYLMIK